MDRGYVKCHWRGSNGQQSHTAALGSLRNLSKSKVNPNGQPIPTVSSDCQRRVFGSADEIVTRLCQTFKGIPRTLAPVELFPPRREGALENSFCFENYRNTNTAKTKNAPFWSVGERRCFSDDRIIPEKISLLVLLLKGFEVQNLRDSVRICKKKNQMKNCHSDECARTFPPGRSAFKISMIHRNLQFILIIADCCVLHRSWSRVIHR